MAEFIERKPDLTESLDESESNLDEDTKKKLEKMGVDHVGLDYASLVRLAMFDSSFPPPPGPAQNMIQETLDIKLEIPQDEQEDIEMEGLISDGEEETDPHTYAQVLQGLGFLASPEKSECELSNDEKANLCQLLHGLTLAQKGHELLAQGCSKIKTVIAQQPSMHKLGGLLELVKNTDPQMLKAAKQQSKIPQTLGSSAIAHIYKPLKLASGKFQCKICEIETGSWVGCDSHIRKVHTNIYYGPCPHCETYQTTAQDCFRRHVVNCIQTKATECKDESK